MGAAVGGVGGVGLGTCGPEAAGERSSGSNHMVSSMLFCAPRGGSLPENGDRKFTYDFDGPVDNFSDLDCGAATPCTRAAALAKQRMAEWRPEDDGVDRPRPMQVSSVDSLYGDHISPWTKRLEVDKDRFGHRMDMLCGFDQEATFSSTQVPGEGHFVADTPSIGTIVLDRKGTPIWKEEPSLVKKRARPKKQQLGNSAAMLDMALRRHPTGGSCPAEQAEDQAHEQLEGEARSVEEAEAKLSDLCEGTEDESDFAHFTPQSGMASMAGLAADGRRGRRA